MRSIQFLMLALLVIGGPALLSSSSGQPADNQPRTETNRQAADLLADNRGGINTPLFRALKDMEYWLSDSEAPRNMNIHLVSLAGECFLKMEDLITDLKAIQKSFAILKEYPSAINELSAKLTKLREKFTTLRDRLQQGRDKNNGKEIVPGALIVIVSHIDDITRYLDLIEMAKEAGAKQLQETQRLDAEQARQEAERAAQKNK